MHYHQEPRGPVPVPEPVEDDFEAVRVSVQKVDTMIVAVGRGMAGGGVEHL